MTDKIQMLPNGFGDRLKSERKRLGMSQTQLGDLAGTNKQTQLQYESEFRSPTIRYLAEVIKLGVDIGYLIFGSRMEPQLLTEEDVKRIERKTLDLVSEHERKLGTEGFSNDDRYLLFEVTKSHLMNAKISELKSVMDTHLKSA